MSKPVGGTRIRRWVAQSILYLARVRARWLALASRSASGKRRIRPGSEFHNPLFLFALARLSSASTSTSSLIYYLKERVSEKCVLLCKRYIRRMFDIPMDVGLCWYPVWTSVASPFQIEPLRARFFYLFSGISFPYNLELLNKGVLLGPQFPTRPGETAWAHRWLLKSANLVLLPLTQPGGGLM